MRKKNYNGVIFETESLTIPIHGLNERPFNVENVRNRCKVEVFS